jgi:hypothetical protein
MESLYYVMCWACHRKCRHCYEDRFRPYIKGELKDVLAEAQANFPRVIEHLPDHMTYLDRSDPLSDGSLPKKIGRIVLSGGESLIDPVRERITYPVIEQLQAKYNRQIKIVVQTTGDILTPAIVDDLLERGVYMISVASMDDYHVGFEGEEKRKAFRNKITNMLDAAGLHESGLSSSTRKWHDEEGPLYSFFGATPESWIGKIWPRGRGWLNDLSTATLEDNFCNRWSGALGFLDHEYDGSEVSIEPDGGVYPCCVKTRLPIGNLVEESLIDILQSLKDEPAYHALNRGNPQGMGLGYGWSEQDFIENSKTLTPAGNPYQNLCIGCDAFHLEVLKPVLDAARERRRTKVV